MRVRVIFNVFLFAGTVIFLFANPLEPYWEQESFKYINIHIPFYDHRPMSIESPGRIARASKKEKRYYTVYTSYNGGPWRHSSTYSRWETVREAVWFKDSRSKTINDNGKNFEINLTWRQGEFLVYVNNVFIARSFFDLHQ